MESTKQTSIKCSAPSKALITGAYLITERFYEGIVVSWSARFNTTMTINFSQSEDVEYTKIRCISRQMDENDWVFKLTKVSDRFDIEFVESGDSGPAKYAYYVLVAFFSILPYLKSVASDKIDEFSNKIKNKLIDEIIFEFVGDDSFYGQRLPDGRLAKTGMGSSATFIASFIGCLYSLVSQNTEFSEEQLKEIHILAQIANSVCQNKIGSGFDIASAVYGSLIFRRFDPSVLDVFSQDLRNLEFYSISSYYECFYNDFNFDPKRFTLPKHFHLCMICLSEGSDTKVMVKNLLEWSKDRKKVFTDSDDENDLNPDSIFTWKEWENVNKRGIAIIELFEKMNLLESNVDYTESIQSIIKNNATDDDFVHKVIKDLRKQNNNYRLDLSCITMLSGVQVEPMRATEILDKIKTEVSECVMIGVPGAGGDDAAYMLYLSTDEDQTSMREIIKEKLEKVNAELKSQCWLLDIQTNTKGAIKFETL